MPSGEPQCGARPRALAAGVIDLLLCVHTFLLSSSSSSPPTRSSNQTVHMSVQSKCAHPIYNMTAQTHKYNVFKNGLYQDVPRITTPRLGATIAPRISLFACLFDRVSTYLMLGARVPVTKPRVFLKWNKVCVLNVDFFVNLRTGMRTNRHGDSAGGAQETREIVPETRSTMSGLACSRASGTGQQRRVGPGTIASYDFNEPPTAPTPGAVRAVGGGDPFRQRSLPGSAFGVREYMAAGHAKFFASQPP